MRNWPIFSLIGKILPSAVTVVVATAVIIAALWALFPETIGDLVPNLMAEFIGIFLTVALVGILLNLLEEQRRLPAKCLAYAELLGLTDKFLSSVLPEPLREPKVRRYKYRYADIYASSVIAPLDEASLSHLPVLIAQDISDRGSFDVTPFVDLKKELEVFIHHSIDLLDPGPRSLLLRLVFVQLRRIPTDIDQGVPSRSRELAEEPTVASPQGCLARLRRLLGCPSGTRVFQWGKVTDVSQNLWISGEQSTRAEYIQWVIGVVFAMVKLRIWLQRVLRQYFVVSEVT